MWCGLAVVVALAGCGRRDFDALTGRDAGIEIDAPSCPHSFCDDFDRITPASAGWNGMSNTGNGTLTLAGGVLVVTIPTNGDSAFLTALLPVATASVRIAFRISYTSAMNAGEIDLVQLRWDTPTPGCSLEGVFLVHDSTGPFDLQETYSGCGTGNVDTPLVDLSNTGFHDVVMTITLGPLGTAHIRVVIDHGPPTDVVAAHPIPSSSSSLNIGAGAVYNVTSAWDIRYDDLTIDVL